MKFRNGFSLVEITIALLVLAIMITGVLSVMPQGMQAARDAEFRTITGLILEDVRDRMEGERMEEGVPEISPLFYDGNGRFVLPNSDKDRQLARFYRVDLEFVKPKGDQMPVDAHDLMAARLEIGWPVDIASEEGELLGEYPSKLHQTFLLTALTGPDWEEIDPNYQPKVEF